MKKMKLYTPIVRLTQSQHCKCSWCEAGTDPIREGVCRKCHDKLQAQLSSQKWIRLRQSYLATLETGYCHGFLVATPQDAKDFVSTMLAERHCSISATGILIPDGMFVDPIIIERSQALIGLHGIVPAYLRYYPCGSIVPIAAKRIDHTLPWHCYPSLFWHSENHQQLCLDCNAKKTQLDGSHRTNSQRSV